MAEMPCEMPETMCYLREQVAERRGAAQVLKQAIAAVEAEDELDGLMPDEVRAAILKTPELVLRANVRATKESIIQRLRALAIVTPETGAP